MPIVVTIHPAVAIVHCRWVNLYYPYDLQTWTRLSCYCCRRWTHVSGAKRLLPFVFQYIPCSNRYRFPFWWWWCGVGGMFHGMPHKKDTQLVIRRLPNLRPLLQCSNSGLFIILSVPKTSALVVAQGTFRAQITCRARIYFLAKIYELLLYPVHLVATCALRLHTIITGAFSAVYRHQSSKTVFLVWRTHSNTCSSSKPLDNAPNTRLVHNVCKQTETVGGAPVFTFNVAWWMKRTNLYIACPTEA